MNLLCPNCQTANRLPDQRLADSPMCGKCKEPLLRQQVETVDDQQLERYIQCDSVPIVVDFWAPWCAPCKQFAPAFAQVAEEFPSPVRFLKLDIAQHQQPAATYNISSIPTIIVFHQEKESKRLSQAMTARPFAVWLQGAIEGLN